MTFEYKPRTVEQWQKRIDQSWQSNRTFRPRPEPLRPRVESDPEIGDAEPEDGDDSETPKSKVSSTTPCLCGHPRKDHHTTPESHGSDHAFYCITAHCAVFSYRDGVSAPCDCGHFRTNETDAPKFTKPRVGPHDLCAGCGHFKISHCTKTKPGKADRLKPGEMTYRILQKADGTSYGCRHFDLENPKCQCDSTGCSATPDGKKFCECLAFQNPWLVRKTRVAAKPRKKRTQKNAFVTGAPELFPRGETSANP